MSDTNNTKKKHNMKTRKDADVKDSDIDYNTDFDIDTDTDNNNNDSESDNDSQENNESENESNNVNIDNEKFLKRKFQDILDSSDNTIIIVNTNDNTNKRTKRLKKNQDEDDDNDEDDDDNNDEDEDYYDEYDPENPYNSFTENFEEEMKKATELIKKNEDVIKDNPNFKNYNRNDVEYFLNLPKRKKRDLIKIEKYANSLNKEDKPLRFKILESNIDDKIKSLAIKKLNLLNSMNEKSGEYFKVLTYVENLCKIPCGIYKPLEVSNKNTSHKISSFLNKSYDILNNNVYGHKNSKEQIIRIIAQWVSNPTLKGNVIGIHGSPGIGKTKLIKDGLSKALNLPFVFIPLGGVNDSSYLTGHSFTYEGAIHGKIVDSLMKAECMNPIIYFDELDKISDSTRGEEIINTLIHLTDSTQNDSFFDKYFYDIPLDLSKALIIFTYNNDNYINPILKDRMIRINTDNYNTKDKVNISKEFLIPELCKDFNINLNDLIFTDNILKYIISKTDKEDGVRNLKRSLECIISNINLYKLINYKNNSLFTSDNYNDNNNNDKDFLVNKLNIKYTVPFKVDNYIVDNLIKKKYTLSESIAHIYI